jgi:hypothetical protein
VADRRKKFTNGAGIAVASLPALLLALPNDPQPIGLGVLAGVLGGAALLAVTRYRTITAGVTTAAVTWGVWAAGRLVVTGEEGDNLVTVALVRQQLAWLSTVVALSLFVAAWVHYGTRARHLGWPAAVAAELSWALANQRWAPRVLETWTMPFAVFLLVAGILANRMQPAHSGIRYGSALGMALIPSACASWAAPWVAGNDGESTEHLVRLIIVLAVGAVGLIVGVWRKQAGWFVPSAVGASIAAASQIWTSIAALPRWVALALAGSALVAAGARIEGLQRRSQRSGEWLRRLT